MGCLKSLILGRETQFWILQCISRSSYTISPPFPHFPSPKGQRSLLTLLLEISLCFFLHADLNCDLVFESKTKMGGKYFFPWFFPHFPVFFFKNFALGPCWMSKVINIRSGNSIQSLTLIGRWQPSWYLWLLHNFVNMIRLKRLIYFKSKLYVFRWKINNTQTWF